MGMIVPPDTAEKDENCAPACLEQAATYLLVAVIVLLLMALVTVVLQSLGVLEIKIVSNLSGLSDQSEVLKFLGIGLGGVVLMLQAVIANKRARAMGKTAMAQAQAAAAQARANQNTEEGQRQERLKNAIEHLGNDSESVRLGGAYELFHLAQDTEPLRQTVLDILCSHIRQTTKDDKYRKDHPLNPSEEIQSLLTLLFVQEHSVFLGLRINLYQSWLNGADLSEARLRGANLRGASLNNARFIDAHLEGVNLLGANLKEAQLRKVCLREAVLYLVCMQGSDLEEAQLQGANIIGGRLTGANLRHAHLQGAYLANVQMFGATLSAAAVQGAHIMWPNLEGARLDNTNLQGAGGQDWEPSSSFSDRVRGSTGKSGDLSSVTNGGLKREHVEQLVNELLSPTKQEALRLCLEPHIDTPIRRGLPEGHGSVTGSYSREDAEKWISEHESAMGSGASK